MDKEKEIEEMFDIVKCGLDIQLACGDEVEVGDKQTAAAIIVKDLQKAGYGNIEQAVREFAENIQNQLNNILKKFKPKPTDNLAQAIYNISNKIDELIKERFGEG